MTDDEMILRYEPSPRIGLAQKARGVWEDWPLYIAPFAAVLVGLALIFTPETYALGRGYALFKYFTASGLIPGLAMLLAGVFKLVSVTLSHRVLLPAALALASVHFAFLVSALVSRAWIASGFYLIFLCTSLWGPTHAAVVPRGS